MTKDIAKSGGDQLPAYLKSDEYKDFVDNSLENGDKDAFAIPFLRILQSNSPPVKRTSGKYIDGAAEGMLFNTVSQEVFNTEKEVVSIVPVYYRRAFMEWKTREDGGGYVAEHPPLEGQELLLTSERDEKNRDILPNGNQISDTRYHYVMLVHADGSFEPLIITMERTQLKKSKRLNSDINLKRKAKGVPALALQYKVGIEGESKDDNSWWGWDLKFSGLVQDQALFDAAVEFQTQIRAGEIKEATDSLVETDDEEAQNVYTEDGTEF